MQQFVVRTIIVILSAVITIEIFALMAARNDVEAILKDQPSMRVGPNIIGHRIDGQGNFELTAALTK